MRWSFPKHDFHHKEFLQNKEIIGTSKKRMLTIRPQKQQQQQKWPVGNNVMLRPPIILPTTTILSPKATVVQGRTLMPPWEAWSQLWKSTKNPIGTEKFMMETTLAFLFSFFPFPLGSRDPLQALAQG